MPCLGEPTILAFVAGRIPDRDAATIDSHLDECRSCRDLIVAAAQTTLAPAQPGEDAAASSPAPATVPAGERYRIEALIGHGAQGLVYTATDTVLGREVALKLLRPGVGGRHGDQILDEARIVAKLAHPNIVCVHDAGATGDGAIYLAMEYVAGGTLASWLRTPRTSREILRACVDAGLGLAAAHRAGVIHRDIKPTNILIGADGRARITDFGLATAPTTAAGAIVGTPAFMAPEQVAGAASAASDQFALAVTTWHALTGANPFAGTTLEARGVAIHAGPRAPARQLPRHVEAALRRALAPEPADRFPAVDELVVALERDPSVKRRRAAFATLAGVAIIATTALAATRGDPADPCASLDGELAGIWDRDAGARLDAAFASSPVKYAAKSGAEAHRRLDAYATEWIAARTRTCRSGGETAALGRQCLWERRASLATVARTLGASPDAKTIEHAADLAGALPGVETCENAGYLRERIKPPTDPAAVETVDEVAALVRDSATALVAGKHDDARALATRAVTAARAIDHPPSTAIAALALGRAEIRTGRHVPARASLEAAAAAAQRGHDDVTAAAAWIDLVNAVGYAGGKHEDALRYAAFADATIGRIGGNDDLRAALETQRCGVLGKMARLAEATAACAAARAIRTTGSGADELALANILIQEARLLIGTDPDAATQRAASAVAIRETRLGPEHPSVIEAVFMAGQVAAWQGAYDRAAAAYDRAAAIAVAAFGESSAVMATIWAERAQLAVRRGALLDAQAANDRSLAIRETVFDPTHVELVFNLSMRGRLLDELGKPAEAIAALTRALEIADAGLGPDHPTICAVLEDLARLHAREGKAELARSEITRAVDIAKRLGDPGTIAVATGVFAELLHTGGAPAEALPHYLESLAAQEAIYGPDAAPLYAVLVNLAIAQLETGHAAAALPYVERAVAIEAAAAGPTSMRLLLPLDVLGDVQVALGHPTEARAAWQRALALPDLPPGTEPGLALIRKKLAKLRRR